MRPRPARLSVSVGPPWRRHGWMGLALAVVAVTAAMGIATPSSSAYIYVGGPITSWQPKPSTIERLTLDGSAVQPSFIAGPRVESADQLHVDGDRLYWLDTSAGDCRAKSASLAGTDIRQLATLSPGRCGSFLSMALGDGYLYWNTEDGTIGRLSIQPPYSVEPDFIRLPHDAAHLPEATSLVSDGAWLYWWDDVGHTVGRARLDGTDVEPVLFRSRHARLLGVAQGYLWWQDGLGTGSVGRARLDGSNPEPAYLTGVQLYDGALTSQWLYYTGSPSCDGCVNVDGVVRRIALEPGATPEFIAQGLGEGAGSSIAVDSLGDPFPAVRIIKHGDGTATAVVSTPRPANVSVHGTRILPKRARHGDRIVARVAIRPRRATVHAMRRHGAAHVRVRINYRPFRGLSRSDKRTVTLRLH